MHTHLEIGIVGCGHLGLALAKALEAHGYPRNRLRVSHGGNADTLASIRRAGLENRIASNADIFLASDIVFITLRPDGMHVLRGLASKPGCLIVSCAAGVDCAALKGMLGADAVRLMPSSPQSIETKTGIAALYPANRVMEDLLFDLDLETVVLAGEKQMHLFTALVCLPAAYLQMSLSGGTRKKIDLLAFPAHRFEAASRVIAWAEANTPADLTGEEVAAYISRMATKGGITEAIVASVRSGSDIETALSAGIRRGEEIAGAVTA